MKISVPNRIAEKLKKQLTDENIVNPDEFCYRDDFEIDLTGRPTDQLDRLEVLFEPYAKEKGMRSVLRDLSAWRSIQDGDLPKMKTCKDGAGIMKAYIARSKRRHIYHTSSGTSGSQSLPYYVSNIEFHPPRGKDNPAYLEISLKSFNCGESRVKTLAWHTEEVRGRTPVQLLAQEGFVLESVVLRDDYEFYLEKFRGIVHAVGEQYLGTGQAKLVGRHYWRDSITLDDEKGNPAKLVVDVIDEDGNKSASRSTSVSGDFWLSAEEKKLRDNPDREEPYTPSFTPEIPTHPYVICFHLKKHERVKVHVQNLTKYEYNPDAKDNLVLPKRDESLLAVLLADTKLNFQDVVAGKSGGVVVLCQGPPGTGKTLTAETYAEGMQRPLYNVQCSQLGLTPEALEKELLVVFARAARWNAVLLLDEADVYIHQRGSDLHQNAIVGVFLRVLEYYDGVLFMTTNRADTVDDAVLSRCTARITYGVPPVEDQERIWNLLLKANGMELSRTAMADIVLIHNDLSGRDIKNLVKLCMMVHQHTGRAFDADLVQEMRQFKPTLESK